MNSYYKYIVSRIVDESEVSKKPTIDLYHVTHTKNVDKIKSKGITLMNTTNWRKGSADGERYGSGEIYAFNNKKDAHKWAAKMDWDFNKKMGTGKISVVQFKGHRENWEKDESDPISQASHEGDWLKSDSPVSPEHLVGHEPLNMGVLRG